MSAPTSRPAILVLGGTGKVGSRIVRQLSSYDTNHLVLVASRKAPSSSSQPAENGNDIDKVRPVHFDWDNTDTWSNPFDTLPAGTATINAVYIIAPPSLNAEALMNGFVDFARDRGVRRFVLQSASCVEAGGLLMGKVHAYLRELGQRDEVEWAVLRPTWFQQNFADQENHVKSIREESKIYSATGDGKIPWVSADDIAAVAVRALTARDPPNTEYLVLGSELLSYGDIATILSEVLGRRIVHVDLTAAGLEERFQSFGMPEDYSRMMSALDISIKNGAENRTNDVILAVTGSAPRKFKDFAESAKEVWGTGSRA
ncbi:uncharacterized protein B0T15DRAFT_564552 [Chaetomium strumarium]|uniref:NAD(P)-binding domain-containing protein n=1 Tax=Chaetomium strumarium TaxID=1170767 RepID=A0AAJ0H2P8_9PEZI|nr:hypothetical protein B0T15DRAFT_564552 [Chaetomium strumarium]